MHHSAVEVNEPYTLWPFDEVALGDVPVAQSSLMNGALEFEYRLS